MLNTQTLWQLVLYGLTQAGITNVGGLEKRFGLEDVSTKSLRHAATALVNDIIVVIMLSYQKRVCGKFEVFISIYVNFLIFSLVDFPG